MQHEKSQNRTNELTAQMDLLRKANTGQLESLDCPKCRHATVSVWFSHPGSDVYRTWFICSNCDFHSRAQNAEKPPFFSEDRVSTELEEKDMAILRQSLFKRPPLRKM